MTLFLSKEFVVSIFNGYSDSSDGSIKKKMKRKLNDGLKKVLQDKRIDQF